MKLEILNFSDALKYVPMEKTYAIRVFDSIPMTPIPSLVESTNWEKIDNFYFIIQFLILKRHNYSTIVWA